jgi:DNA primase
MAAASPDRYLINMAQRAGRNAGIDAAAWSRVRAALDPQRFTMVTAPALPAKGKPWRDYCETERTLVGRK